MTYNVKKMALIAVIAGGTLLFNACSDDEVDESLSNNQRQDIDLYQQTNSQDAESLFAAIDKHFSFFPNTYIVSYMDNVTNQIVYTLVSPKSELGKKIQKCFMQKMSTFSGDYESYCRWAKWKMDKGNIVVGSYDKKTGKYSGISYTKLEYTLIFG